MSSTPRPGASGEPLPSAAPGGAHDPGRAHDPDVADDPEIASEAGDIEDLVVECLGRIEDEGPGALEALCRAHPSRAAELRARVELLARAGLSPSAGAADEFPESLGDFDLDRRIGAGGMGVVFRATQRSLGRAVALKLIHPSELYFPGARARFRREVETVAQLQHPNVVPIYAVGEESGIPYFAMELVQGASLADVVEALKHEDVRSLDGAAIARVLAARAGVPVEPSGVWNGSWIDAALRIVREAAEALEYVHRRGVVHRDIKPSNVMLTRAGRILLVDFGLARGTGDSKITRTGSQLGSLAYMAQEQLAGKDVDARVDVYALGAVLWELVALRPAFHGDDFTQLQRAIAEGSKPKLSTLNPNASEALETVLAKAMAPAPERRYASAADFARDLDNLLARRPIEARRASTLERLKLWATRRPAEAAAVALGVLLFVGAPTLIAWREVRARGALEEKQGQLSLALGDARDANTALEAKQRELTSAFEDVKRERDVAEANFRAAMEAVERMLTRVGDKVLQRVPQMELVRRDLLTDALEFCERFLSEQQGNSKLRLETAMARMRVADIHASLGEYTKTHEELQRAIGEYEQLIAQRPDDEDLRRKSIEARTTFGRVLHVRKEFAESERVMRKVLEDIAALRGTPERARAILEARAHMELARPLGGVGKLLESRDELAAAVRALERLASDPNDRFARLLLVQIHARAGAMASDLAVRGDPNGEWMDSARADLTAAIELAEPLIAERGDLQLRSDYVDSLGDIGITYIRQGRPADAAPWLERAVAESEKLARDFPGIVDHSSDLAQTLSLYGYVLGEAGRIDESLAALRRAVEIGDRLIEEHPDVTESIVRQAGQIANLGWRELELGRVDEGVKDVMRATEMMRAVRAKEPQDETARVMAATAYLMAGRAELARGAPDAAVLVLREARACGVNPVEMPYFAAYLAQAAAAVRADAKRAESEREALADAWLDEALDALIEAAANGLDKTVLGDPALADLHARESWKRLEQAFAETSH